ncbi:hypothetical protein DFH06DRAFT_1428193 [Mycena polygramma]|nr:hypothetical protein DFH06DRAFT_1428193 [Mycena polygramma]
MSDADGSYEPSSDGPGTTYALSQQHQAIYDERKSERRAEQAGRIQNKWPKLEFGAELSVKQESSSPCSTPRTTAVAANKLFVEQFAGALNSQMGDGTFVEQFYKDPIPRRGCASLPPPDEMDIDLLRLRCNDAEGQRDDAFDSRDEAIKARNEAWEELERVRDSFYQAIAERDAAVDKCKEWEEASVSARRLIELASGHL